MASNASIEKSGGPIVLSICGTMCEFYANQVKRALTRVPGVSSAEVDRESNRATVLGAPNVEKLFQAVRSAGYDAELVRDVPGGRK